MIMTPWKRLAPWVILLVQEPCLWYINLYYKNLGYKIYTTILKNHMKTTLDAIIGENQSAAIESRMILHTFSTTREVIDVSHNLNSSLAWLSLNFRETLTRYVWTKLSKVNSALFKFGYGDKFIHDTEVPYTNIQPKTKKNALLSEPFTLIWGVRQGFPLL